MTAIEILTAIGGTKSLATLDGFARTVWQRWGAKEVTDEQAQSLAEAIEARKREVRGVDTVAQRAPHVAALAKGQGRPSHFPPKRKAATFARTAGVDRAAPDAGGVRPDAAAARQPIHNGRAGGLAAGRRRGAGQAALHAHPGGTRGPRGRRDHHGPQRHPRGGRPRLSDHRGAAPRQAAQPLQCRAGRLARMAASGSSAGGKIRAPAERTPTLPLPRGEGPKKWSPRIKVLNEPIAETAFHAVNIPKNPPKSQRSVFRERLKTRLRREKAFR